MQTKRRSNDAVHWFIGELTSRIIADSGIPSDRFHLGKMILQSFKDAPDFVSQIDGATDQSETSAETLKKSVRCAISMKGYGLVDGDVIAILAPNHLDVAAPFYAALYLGVAVAAVDRTLGVRELKRTFDIIKPKIVFCQSEKASDIQLALNELDLDSLIVTFDKRDYFCSFSEFLERCDDDSALENFIPSNFNCEDTNAFLIATSGTTGLPKCAAITHKNMAITGPYVLFTRFPTPIQSGLLASPLQWLAAIIQFLLAPLMRYTRVQTSENFTPEHAYHLINRYRPTFLILSPTVMTTLVTRSDRDQCDFTSLEVLLLGGSAVPQILVEEVKKLSPETDVLNTYGMSEIASLAFQGDFPPPGSCGKPLGCLQYRILDVDTGEDINEPNIPGELLVKGPGIFKGYYNNPEATANTFAEDGWFKTGDLFYRDENWNYYFMERIKLLLKYKNHQISPVEIEDVIRQHPEVQDVAVTSVPDPECGDLSVACVVLRHGAQVSAQAIKDLVEVSLSDAKKLRGGVIFVNELPQTASNKINRKKLKALALNMERF